MRKNVLFLFHELMEKRQDKVRGRLPGALLQSNYREQPCMTCTHLGRKMLKNKLELLMRISSDHLPNTMFICRNISICAPIKKQLQKQSISTAAVYLKVFYLSRKKGWFSSLVIFPVEQPKYSDTKSCYDFK